MQRWLAHWFKHIPFFSFGLDVMGLILAIHRHFKEPWVAPCSVKGRLPKREAYVTFNAFKTLMATMIDMLLQPVTKQVRKIKTCHRASKEERGRN